MSLSGWMLVVLLSTGYSYDIHIERDLTQKNCYLLARTIKAEAEEAKRSSLIRTKCVEEEWEYD